MEIGSNAVVINHTFLLVLAIVTITNHYFSQGLVIMVGTASMVFKAHQCLGSKT